MSDNENSTAITQAYFVDDENGWRDYSVGECLSQFGPDLSCYKAGRQYDSNGENPSIEVALFKHKKDSSYLISIKMGCVTELIKCPHISVMLKVLSDVKVLMEVMGE